MNWAYDIAYMYGARPMFAPNPWGARPFAPQPRPCGGFGYYPPLFGNYGYRPDFGYRPMGPNPALLDSIMWTERFMGLAYLYNTVKNTDFNEKYYCEHDLQYYSPGRYKYSNNNPYRYYDYSYKYTPISDDCNCKKTKKTTTTKTTTKTPNKTKSNTVKGETDESKNVFLGKTITSKFGMRTLNGKTRMHKGIDLKYAENEEVYSFTDGKVTFAGQQTDKNGNLIGYGNWIEIMDNNGVKHRYAHANKIIAKVGDEVKAGDLIMLAGSTGHSTAPHVHYETRVNDNPVNPFKTWA